MEGLIGLLRDVEGPITLVGSDATENFIHFTF